MRAASDALDALPDTEENAAARAMLQGMLDKAEELYIAEGEEADEEQNGDWPRERA